MAKRPAKPSYYSWNVYQLRHTPAKLIGIVHDAPDEKAAIAKAIEEYKVPPQLHGRLIAQRRK
jgi:hypothetical protein